MKNLIPSLRPFALAAAALSLVLLGAAHARAQANLTVSGGFNTPLTLTLTTSVAYTVTTPGASGIAPYFVFRNLGNFTGITASGSMTFTINGGPAQTLSIIASGFTGGSVVATDGFVGGSFPGVAVTNVVVLQAGSLTTNGNFVGAPPSGGSFQTFLMDANGTRLSAVDGLAVPEPSTWALLGLGLAATAIYRRRHA